MLFKEDELPHYDFSLSPTLIRARNREELGAGIFGERDIDRWASSQSSFLRWTQDKRIFASGYIQRSKAVFDAFFQKRGSLRGRVLDIGGGWGLYRQWWDARESDLFVVHDPSVERFLRGPHRLHQYYYERAFGLPMTFVEGFGEHLPYKNGIFDISLCAATLDHCVDPTRVIAEAGRCAKPEGSVIIIQTTHSSEPSEKATVSRRIRHASRHVLKNLYVRALYGRAGHLHNFTGPEVRALLERTGFTNVTTSVLPNISNVYAYEARKTEQT